MADFLLLINYMELIKVSRSMGFYSQRGHLVMPSHFLVGIFLFNLKITLM